MISKKVVEMINQQINREFESGYLYQGMEMYIGNETNFKGIENFFHVQVQEEQAHCYLMIDYLHRLGEKVFLEDVPRPKVEYKSVLDVYEAALAHERKVTSWINEIMAVAVEEHDFASQSFLKFFIDEQVEEEENFINHIETLKLIKDDAHGILLFDQQMAQRVFVPPVMK